jgi:hypothetical protein
VATVGLITEQSLEGRIDGGAAGFALTSLAGVNAGYVDAAQQVYHFPQPRARLRG